MKVFLDMDGVLVDFMSGIHEAVGEHYDYSCYHHELGKWDMLEDLAPFEKVNALCTADFWANLPWMHDGHDILRAVVKTFGDNVVLLTTPMPNEGSRAGKAEWVKRNIPHFSKKLIVTRIPKETFAAPNNILIDDRDENCDKWSEVGGVAVQIPRPWNRFYGQVDAPFELFYEKLKVASATARCKELGYTLGAIH